MTPDLLRDNCNAAIMSMPRHRASHLDCRCFPILIVALQHYVTKHLQQGIESDHFRVKRPMPRVGGFQSFHTARRTIRGFEAMLWLRKGFSFAGPWTVCEQNRLLSVCFGLPTVNKA